MTADERLTHFSKSREQIVGRFKRAELPYVQGTQSSEEDLVVWERVPIRTNMISVRELVTYGNHSLVDQAQNNGPSANSQEITVSTENVRYEGTKDQSVTYPSG